MDNFKDIIDKTSREHYNVLDQYKDNDVELNKDICRSVSLPFAVGALSITGDLNIGIMIRTASLLAASDFYIFGRRKYDRRSTVGAENYIELHRGYDVTGEDIRRACGDKYFPVFIEQGGDPLLRYNWYNLEDRHEMWAHGPMFIFGSESDGVPSYILDEFTDPRVITIPQRGVLRSFNVSTAMSIVCWEYFKWYNTC